MIHIQRKQISINSTLFDNLGMKSIKQFQTMQITRRINASTLIIKGIKRRKLFIDVRVAMRFLVCRLLLPSAISLLSYFNYK